MIPADSPQRDRGGETIEAAFRCSDPDCRREWFVVAVHGEPSDALNPRECRYCGAPDARRIR